MDVSVKIRMRGDFYAETKSPLPVVTSALKMAPPVV
jgi:hypothetical protein